MRANSKPTSEGAAPQAGDVWAVPVSGVGLFPLVIARGPVPNASVSFAFAYLLPKVSESMPDPTRLPPLEDWGQAWIGLVPLRPFRTARWKRVGTLPRFEPADWPVVPCGSCNVLDEDLAKGGDDTKRRALWTVETTRDEPTMTLLDNAGVTQEVMRQFPAVQPLTQASKFEAALRKHVRKQRPCFWDLHLSLNNVDQASLLRWSSWASGVRERCSQRIEPAIPAGRQTDRSVKPGDWLGLPLSCGGFGAALVVRRKAGVVIFGDAVIYGFPRKFDYYPSLADVQYLTPNDACLVAGT